MKAMTVLFGAAGLAIAGASGAVDAPAAETLAGKNGCLACHAVDRKLYGSSFRDIAARYRNDPDAEAKLMTIIRTGSNGRSSISMPASPQIPEPDRRSLARWILAQ